MARLTDEGLAPTYAAAAHFVEQALRDRGSMFRPGVAIWTQDHLQELTTAFIEHPGFRDLAFEDQFRRQLERVSPGATQLAAEMLYVYLLPVSNIGGDSKRATVNEVLSWTGQDGLMIPPDLSDALNRGFGSGGTAFSVKRHAQLTMLIRYLSHWVGMSSADREAALQNPWRFRDVLDAVPLEHYANYMREALLYLVHPDAFERIFSSGHKNAIVKKLLGTVENPPADRDEQLAAIRAAMERRFGKGIDFYATTAVSVLWQPASDPWRSLSYWAGRLKDVPTFMADEIDYKLAIAKRVDAARQAMLAGDADWPVLLKRAFGTGNNLTSFYAHQKYTEWVQQDPDAARRSLEQIWRTDLDGPARVGRFLDGLPKEVVSGKGSRTTIASFLGLAVDPRAWPPYKTTEFEKAYALTQFEASGASEAQIYAGCIEFLDTFIAKAAQFGVALSDRLEAQAALWSVITYERQADWLDEEWNALVEFRESRGSTSEIDDEPDVPDVEQKQIGEPAVPTLRADPIPALAQDLLIPEPDVREIAELLETKHQVIFYGPPGTGKTYLARKLAQALAADPKRVRLVQFHPSYAYEDFVEGYRPRLLPNGQPGFELIPGPLRRIAEDALREPHERFVLIIDEINRGNVAKVLGELYFLLEYRSEKVELLYSAEPFTLPENLLIIGTMNTADRSIALMDAALRRRFGFVPFFPDQPPMEGLLRRWLTQNRPSMAWVANVLDEVNRRLDDRHLAVGPSYFMKPTLGEDTIDRIWRHEVRPYLEEMFFDQPERLRDFELAALKAKVLPQAAPADEPPQPVDEPDPDVADADAR